MQNVLETVYFNRKMLIVRNVRILAVTHFRAVSSVTGYH